MARSATQAVVVRIFETCEISSEIATFPYEWDGGAVAVASAAPTATCWACSPDTRRTAQKEHFLGSRHRARSGVAASGLTAR
jgi:hypothetical protein